MSWLKRMFTLPKRYNSLSDIARDPVGALVNTAKWAVPLATLGSATGLLKGLPSLGAGMKGITLDKVFSTETLTKALPVIAAGVSAYGTMQQDKAMRAQQRLAEQDAARARAQVAQAGASQAFLQSLPTNTGTSAANMQTDLLTLAMSPTSLPMQSPMMLGDNSVSDLLNLTEEDLREIVRRAYLG